MDASSLVSSTKSTVMTSGMVTYSPNEDTMAKSFWRYVWSSILSILIRHWGTTGILGGLVMKMADNATREGEKI